MEQMSSKRKPFMFAFFLILLLLAAGYISFSLILPRYIETRVLPALGEKFFSSLNGQVFSVGLNEASLGDIIIGDSLNAAGSIGSIHAEYSLSSILDKKIKNLRINGLTLNLEISAGRISIPGLDIEKITGPKTTDEIPQQDSVIDLPFQFDNFQVANGLLKVSYDNQPVLIPFGLQIKRTNKTHKGSLPVYSLDLQIFSQGDEIDISGIIDLADNKGKFTLAASSLDVKPFAFLLGDLEEILSFDKISIKSNAEIKIMPFQVIATDIDCELKSLKYEKNPATPTTFPGSDNVINSLRLKIKGGGQQWDATVNGSMVDPLSASIALDGSFKNNADGVNGLGTVLLRISDKTVTLSQAQTPLTIKGNPELRGNFSANFTPAGKWLMKIDSAGSKETFDISSGPNSLNAKIPSFSIQGKGSATGVQMQVALKIPDVHATTSDASAISLPMATLQASFLQEQKTGQEKINTGKFATSFPGVKIKRETLTGKADISLTGIMEPQTIQDMKSLQMAGEFIVNNAKAVDKETGITINSMDGRLPWQWSYPERKTAGRLKISGIKWKNNELGSIEAGVKLNGSEYLLDGKFTHSLLNGLVTNISGQANRVDSEYRASLNLQMAPKAFGSLHLGKFAPSLTNSYISGELGLDGTFQFGANGFSGNLGLIMKNGRFEFPDKKYTIENINLNVLMPSLPDLRSAPAQKFLFDRASIGDLVFEQGKVIWQLESTGSFFIEEGVVNWAGGRVFTNAVRISPNRKEFVMPIFCDRLILTEILNQFGVVDAEGEGTVSGRIPLFVGEDTIHFEDGFLYSSPGQGGSVKVAALDVLAAGIPKNTPQFSQVDFAAEALKNFQYNWVKLLLNSEGEDLVMQMQMDGKPLQSLPFSYDSQTGLLQRLNDNTKGISQPIRLDVNFRLPLDRFMGYSGKIQDIMEKIQ